MHSIKFIISGTQYIKITSESIDKDDCEVCAHCDIDYVNKEKNISIRFGYEEISSLCYFISKYEFIPKLIKGEMVLNDHDANNLGIEWNQYFESIIKDTNAGDYQCWTNSHKQIRPYFSSWMYNDKDGNIVFEITPFYSWDEAQSSDPEYVTFEEFMKNYQPIVKTIIPKENLKTWIVQALELKKSLGLHND